VLRLSLTRQLSRCLIIDHSTDLIGCLISQLSHIFSDLVVCLHMLLHPLLANVLHVLDLLDFAAVDQRLNVIQIVEHLFEVTFVLVDLPEELVLDVLVKIFI